jgi:hypothetical protein
MSAEWRVKVLLGIGTVHEDGIYAVRTTEALHKGHRPDVRWPGKCKGSL